MIRNIFNVGLITFLIKPLGYIRDILIAATSGISFYSDVIFLVLRIPFACKQIFVASPYQAAFVPIFIKLKKENELKAINHSLSIIIVSLIFLTPILLFAEIYMENLIIFFDFKFIQNLEDLKFTVLISRIVAPYVVLIIISATFVAVLYSYERFIIASFLPIIINILAILSLYFSRDLSHQKIIYFLSISIIIGAIIEIAILYYSLKNQIIFSKFKFIKSELKRFIKLVIPSVSNDVIYHATKFINVIYAGMVVGGISSLYFANIIAALPIAVFGATMSTVLIPRLASISINNIEKKIQTIQDGIRLALFFTIPTTAFLICFPESIIQILYERGEFDDEATKFSSNILRAYSIGIFPIIINRIILSFYYSELNTLRPFLIYLVIFFINMCLLYIFSQMFGLSGIALAISVSLWCYTFLLAIDLLNRGIIIFRFKIIIMLVKYVIFALVMVLCLDYISINILSKNNFYEFINFFTIILIGGIIFLTLSFTFDNKNIMKLLNKVIS